MNIYYFGAEQYFLVNGKLVDRQDLEHHINNQPICRLLDLSYLENITKFTFSEAAMFSLCFRHRMEITQCDNEPEYGLTTYQVSDSEDGGDYYGEWVGSPELGFKFTLYDPIEPAPDVPKVDPELELELLPEGICPACESGKLKRTNRPYTYWTKLSRYTVPSIPQEICDNQKCNAKWLSAGIWSLVEEFVANNEPDPEGPVTKCKGRNHVLISYWLKDADGYPLERVCDTCRAEVLLKYRPDILTESSKGQDDYGDESD